MNNWMLGSDEDVLQSMVNWLWNNDLLSHLAV